MSAVNAPTKQPDRAAGARRIGGRTSLPQIGDRAAIIFGGSEGIGLAIAKALVGKVCGIGLVARSADKLGAAPKQLRGLTASGLIVTACADVADANAVQEGFDRCVEALGPVSVVINSAGHARPGSFDDLHSTDYSDQLRIHVLGTVHVFKAAIPHLVAQRAPTRLVVISSAAGLQGLFGWSAYNAAKFAQVGLAQSLRAEYGRSKMLITVVCPAAVETPGLAKENKIKPEEVRLAEASVGVMSAEAVATEVVGALVRGPSMVVPGFPTKLLRVLQRLAPSWVTWMLRRRTAPSNAHESDAECKAHGAMGVRHPLFPP